MSENCWDLASGPSDFNTPFLDLDCLDILGVPKYSLPGFQLGQNFNYQVFWRPRPVVVHHTKRKVLELAAAEFVAVGLGCHHCISISVDDHGATLGAYININMPPEQTPRGWSWRDLELDLLMRAGPDDQWRAAVIDLDEYHFRNIAEPLRWIAEREVFAVMDQMAARKFPFLDLRGHYSQHQLAALAKCKH